MAVKTNPDAPDVYDQINTHFKAHNDNYEKAQRKERGLKPDAALPQYDPNDHPFPKMVYHPQQGEAVAKTQDEHGKLLGSGYREQPYPPKPTMDKAKAMEAEVIELKNQVAILLANAAGQSPQPPADLKQVEKKNDDAKK